MWDFSACLVYSFAVKVVDTFTDFCVVPCYTVSHYRSDTVTLYQSFHCRLDSGLTVLLQTHLTLGYRPSCPRRWWTWVPGRSEEGDGTVGVGRDLEESGVPSGPFRHDEGWKLESDRPDGPCGSGREDFDQVCR